MTDDGGRSPGGSTIAASEDTTTHPSSPTRISQDPRTSLQHVRGSTQPPRDVPIPPASRQNEMTEDEATPGVPVATSTTTTPATTKRKGGAGPGGSLNNAIYSGNKVRHLKKDDGEPLWRKDIQYDFLKLVFENDKAVFTNSYEPETIGKQTFANVYIDAMARSSKTSKILRDKLLSEHEPAKNMAMSSPKCEPSFERTMQFPHSKHVKTRTLTNNFQDAPRLKSILKGASEDRPEPNSLDKIKYRPIPRTNPVNLIFVLAQFAPKVTELHFPPPRDFYDLIMRDSLSSESRATAFLWLMWFYLESDFTEEGADENPFGPGVDYGVEVKNQGVPRFKVLDEEQQALENIDTQEEIDYGHAKMRERKRIIEADQAAFQAEHGPPKRGPKPKLHLPPDDGASPAALISRIRPKYESDMDSTRSTPPPKNFGLGGMRIQNVLNKNRNSLKHHITEGSSPVPHEKLPGESTMRRPRPLTAHQLAVERNRNQRVDYILGRGLRKSHYLARKRRKQEGAFYRAMTRASMATDPFEDSEGEDSYMKDPGVFRERGFIGLVQLDAEDDDFGEEISAYAAAFRRMTRRLDRWDGQKDLNLGVMGTNRVPQHRPADADGNNTVRDNDETEDEKPPGRRGKHKQGINGDVNMDDEEDLDEMEKELLGLGSGEDDEAEAEAEADEDLDDVDKELLGIGGDETEEEGSEMDVD